MFKTLQKITFWLRSVFFWKKKKLTRLQQTAKITVSTLGEARFFAKHQFPDILYAVPIVKFKLPAVYQIAQSIRRFHVLVDTEQAAEDLIGFIESQSDKNISLGVYVDVDTGYHRSGFDPTTQEGLKVIRKLASCSRLHFSV